MKYRASITVTIVCWVFLSAGCFYDVDRSKISDEGADGDSDLSDGGAGDSGIGEECTSDTDCAGLQADFCLTDMATQVGFCTIKDCTFENCPTGVTCPGGYDCCDCDIPEDFLIQLPSVCISEADAEAFIGGFAAYEIACTCG